MNTDNLGFIERNFHIMNDDRFIMEKISLPIEQEDGEDIHAAINRTRETIVANFKAAYPKVYTSLNFDEVIQVNNGNVSKKEMHSFILAPEPPNHSNNELIAMQEESHNYHSPSVEQVKKEMQSYKLGAKAFKAVYELQVQNNPELQEIFDEKLKELSTPNK